MKAVGKLVIIGGAVNKGSFSETDYDQNVEKNLNFFERGILRKIIEESRLKENSIIEIITTASQIPQIVGPEYKKAFEFLGSNNHFYPSHYKVLIEKYFCVVHGSIWVC